MSRKKRTRKTRRWTKGRVTLAAISLVAIVTGLFLLYFSTKPNYAVDPAEFVCTIKSSGGDYTTLVSWQSSVQADLTVDSTKVFNWDAKGSSGVPADGVAVWKSTDHNVTAVCVHATGTTSGQVLLKTIAGGTFADNDIVQYQTDTNYSVTLSDGGNSAIAVAEVYDITNGLDNGAAFTIDGWTLSATNYLKIYAPSAERHSGLASSGAKIKNTTASSEVIEIQEGFVRIENLILEQTIADYAAIKITNAASTGDEVRIKDCVIYNSNGSPGSSEGIEINGSSKPAPKIFNNIIYDFSGTNGAGITTGGEYNPTVLVYNNTIYNCYNGIKNVAGALTAKNNIADEPNASGDGFSGSMTSEYNASSDASASGTGSRVSQEFSYADEANDDFHIARIDLGAKGYGLNDPGSGLYSTDIDGNTRPNAGNWDIGADEYYAPIEDFSYYVTITIDNTKVAADETNYPVLIYMNEGDVFTNAQADADDIHFRDTSGNILDHEIEKYDAGNTKLYAWVRIPSLSSSVDTVIYMYYGNSFASLNLENPEGVWDSNYKVVQHMNEDPSGTAPQMKDSTSNDNDGTSAGTMTSGDLVAGKVADGIDFEGTDDYVRITDFDHSLTTLSLSFWAYPTTLGVSQYMGIHYDSAVNQRSFGLKLDTDNKFVVILSDDGTVNEGHRKQYKTTNAVSSAWTHFACTWNSGTLKLYLNGTEETTIKTNDDAITSLHNSTADLTIGSSLSNNSGANFFNGKIDEVRISDVVRDADWITTSYNNRNAPITFSSVSNQYTALTWDGSTDSDWATAANWTPARVPTAQDNVIIDGNGSNAPTLDVDSATVTIASLSLGSTTSSTLTISNGDATHKLITTDDVNIGANGTLTHTANTTAETHCAYINVGGNLTIASGGKIDVDDKGYDVNEGPGAPPAVNYGGASHGGEGGVHPNNNSPTATYGSITAPVNLGSGGRFTNISGTGGKGGGAAILTVTGTTTINGTISADGQMVPDSSHNSNGGGSGGSVYITAGNLIGSGSITADGGPNNPDDTGGAQGVGGGGRIAVILTGTGNDFTNFPTSQMQAYGVNNKSGSTTMRYSGAGTIYTETLLQGSGKGDLLVDNTGAGAVGDTYASKEGIGKTLIPTTEFTNNVLTLGTIVVKNYAMLEIPGGNTLTTTGDITVGTSGSATDTAEIISAGNVADLFSIDSISFDGTDDYIDCGTDASLTASSGGFSASAWFKRDSIGAAMRIVHKGGQSNSSYDYGLTFGSSNQIFYGCSATSDTITAVRAAAFTDTTSWHHVVGTFDGTSTYKIYIDGVEVSTEATTVSNVATDNLYIGAKNDGSQFFDGLIDEVSIWDATLDADAVTAIYNSGIPIDLTSNSGNYDNSVDLQGYWRSEGVADRYACDFDGTDDHVDIPTVTYTDNHALSVWIYLEEATNSYKNMVGASNYVGNYTYLSTYEDDFKIAPLGSWVTAYNQIPAGEWIHLVIIGDGTDLKIYKNGNTTPILTTAQDTIDYKDITDIGRLHSGHNYWKGMIGQVSLLNGTFGTSDVTDWYNSGTPKNMVNEGGLLGYWRMGDGNMTYPTIPDDSASSNDGTMTNMASGDIRWVGTIPDSSANSNDGIPLGFVKGDSNIMGDAPGVSGATIIADNVTIHGSSGTGASINADEKGYTYDSGSGRGGVGTTSGYGSGAGYGGAGEGSADNGLAGATYGSSTNPIDLGSGGGKTTGGAGGGALKLITSGTLTVNGRLSSDGGAATSHGGGGSGGSVYCSIDTLAGAGIIRTQGGAKNGSGGHGGGGRISIVAADDTPGTFSGTVTSYDGSGATTARDGTTSLTQNRPEVVTLSLPANTATDQALKTVFQFSSTDDDSDNLKYKIELAANSTFTTGLQTFDQTLSQTGWEDQDADSSTTYASGTTATYTVQTALTEETTYYYRVYAIDPSGSNLWSAASSTYSFTTFDKDGTTLYWQGDTSTAWATGSNWSKGSAPSSGDTVIIDANVPNQPVLDVSSASVTVSALTIGSNATSTLTISNGDATHKLIVTNNLTIGANGTLTHTANATAETHRIYLDVGGDLEIVSGGTINVDKKGYRYEAGPGAAGSSEAGVGGTYGGIGGKKSDGTGTLTLTTYGSITAPVNIGSGGYTAGSNYAYGGGAVILDVTGVTTINGTISAVGDGQYTMNYTAGGSGGSIYITTATISGSGTVRANGGDPDHEEAGGGGGGRVSCILTSGNTFGSITFEAHGEEGSSGTSTRSAAGTVYKEQANDAAGRGELIVDNNNIDAPNATTLIPTALFTDSVLTIGDITITNDAKLEIPATYTLTATGDIIIGTSASATDTAQLIGAGAVSSTTARGGDDSLSFDGSTPSGPNRVSINASELKMSTGARSVSLWLKTPASWSTSQGIFCQSGASGGVAGYGARLSSNGTEISYEVYGPSNGRQYSAFSGFPINEWFHLVLVFDGVNNVRKAYANSAELDSTAISDPGDVAGGNDFYIGSLNTVDWPSECSFDDVRVYNDVLSVAEIQNLYGGTSVTDGLIGHWDMEEGSGTTLDDLTANDNDGTLTGGSWVGSGATLNVGSGVTINADDVTIHGVSGTGGSINADGKGFVVATGTGRGWSSGTSGYGSGAGHGGAGQVSTDGSPAGATYGSSTEPITLGSGGGKSTGGAGGGAIKLVTEGTLTVSGRLSADGDAATVDGGGGAGGSVWFSIETLAGAGIIRAQGGAGEDQGGDGGGGRVSGSAADDTIGTFSGTITAYDGSGASTARDGSTSLAQHRPEGATVSYPADEAINQPLKAVIQVTATDDDSDYLRYKIQIATDSAFTANLQTFDQTSSQTGWEDQDADSSTAYASGTTATYAIQAALTEETTYYVRVYAIDYDGSNLFSTASSTTSFTTLDVDGTTLYWQGDTDTDWAVGTNWSGGSAPTSGDTVIIDGNFGNAPILDVSAASVTVSSLTIGSNVASTLTVSNGDATHKLITTDDITIGANGTLTHTANTTTETHRAYIDVGGNLTIASGGTIDVDTKGYSYNNGPGNTSWSAGAGYGGEGKDPNGTNGTTYGSITNPVNIGSAGDGGSSANTNNGGGAAILTVTGATTINGTISAGSVGFTDGYGCGSGGTVNITTATISGTGVIRADGGSDTAAGGNGGGGGGRIAVKLTSGNTFGSITMQAYGGSSYNGIHTGAAGTIYKQTASQGANAGDLIIDNNSVDAPTATTLIKSGITGTTVGNVTIQNNGVFHIDDNITFTISGDFTNNGTLTADTGSTLLIAGAGTSEITGTSTFVNLRCVTAGKTIKFDSTNTTTVSGVMYLKGANGNLITLGPVTAANDSPLTVSGTAEVVYVSASYMNSSGGNAVTACRSTNGGNNTNWTFTNNFIWTNDGADNAYSTAANWTCDTVPIAGDNIIFNSTSTADCNTSGAVSVVDLTMTNDYTGTITLSATSGHDLTSTGTITINQGLLVDNGRQVNFVNLTVPYASTRITSTGKWYQTASGTLSNYYYTNALKIYELAPSITASTTSSIVRQVILGANSTINGTILSVYNVSVNDYITIGSGATINSNVVLNRNNNKTQGAMTINGYVYMQGEGASITNTMTGNWNITGNLKVYGMHTAGSVCTLDTNGYNLTVGGYLKLGQSSGSYPDGYQGAILFSSGTHSIGGKIYVEGQYTHGHFNLGSGTVSVGGDIDFRYASVTVGTSTVTLTGATPTIYSIVDYTYKDGGDPLNTAPFYNLISTTAGQTIDFEDGKTVTVANDLTFTGADGNLITLDSVTGGATTWNLNLSGNSLNCAYLDVKNSDASSGNAIATISSTDSTGNTNWYFGSAGEVVWTNAGGDGLFSTAGNWSTGAVPGAGDTAMFSSASTADCSLAGATPTVANFTMQDGYTGTVTLSGTADQDLTVTDTISIADGTFNDNSRQVNIVNLSIAYETGRLSSNGTFKQTASGTIRNAHYTNPIRTLEIDASVTATLTGLTHAARLILGNNSTITGGSILKLYPYTKATFDDCITQGTGTTISCTVYMQLNHSRTQGAITTSGDLNIKEADSVTVTMTGNWTVGGNLTIHGRPAAGSKATLDTNGNNLTVSGYLRLGDATVTANSDLGEILFSSGTHSIGGNMYVYADADTAGTFNLGSGTISVGGNVNFRRATVVEGTSTVTITDDSRLYACTTGDDINTTPFYNLTCTTAGKALTFEASKTVTIANNLTFTGADGNLITLDSTTPDTAWNLNVSGAATGMNYLDVEDSNASSGDDIVTLNSTDSTGNTGWVFGSANDTYWTNNSGDGLFGTAANWSTGSVPTSSSNVIFDSDFSTANCSLTGASYEIANLTLADDFATSDSYATTGKVSLSTTGGQNLTVSDTVTLQNGKVIDNGRTVNFVNVAIDNEATRLTSTGIWNQTASGTVSNPKNHSNKFNYELADEVTGTISGTSYFKKLVLGANSTVTGGTIFIRPTVNNFIVQDSSATISSNITFATGSKSLGALTISGNVSMVDYAGTITMNGNWDITGNLTIYGVWTEGIGSICTLDTNANTLTVSDNLRLGYSHPSYEDRIYGGILFSSGTHSIGGSLYVHGANTAGTINLGSGTVSVGGDIDFSHSDVTIGTSTVTLIGADTATLYADDFSNIPFHNLTCTEPDKQINFEAGKTVTIANDLTLTGTSGTDNDITLRSSSDGTAWNLNLSGNSLDCAYLDVKDSDASSGNGIATLSSTDSTGNTNWYFGSAGETVWTNGAGDGLFSSAGNWSTGSVPGAGDTVMFSSASTDNCSVTDPYTIANLTLNDDYTGTVTLSPTADEDLTVTDTITLQNGTLDDNGRTINFVNLAIDHEANRIASTGTFKQTADGTIISTYGNYPLYIYEVASGVTATLTGATYAQRIILGANSTVNGSTLYLWAPTVNDSFTQGSGATINSNIAWYNMGTNITQGTITTAAGSNVSVSGGNKTLTMTGNWNVGGDLRIYGGYGQIKNTLDTNGNNLTITGDLRLGLNNVSYLDKYYGEILFSSGTHTIGGKLYTAGQYTHGYINFGSGTINVAGDVDFRYSTVTDVGTSTVNLTTAGAATIYSIIDYDYDKEGDALNTAPFYNLNCTVAGKPLTFVAGKTVTVAGNLTFTGADGNLITLDSTSAGNAWNINLSGIAVGMSYLDVQDSNASSGNAIATISSTNSGNNTNWYFGLANDVIWTNGAGNGLFATAGNWSTESVPGASDNVIFNSTSTADCSVNQALAVTNFSMQDGYTGTVTLSATGGQNLTSTGTIIVNDGTLVDNGRTVNFVNATIADEASRLTSTGIWNQTASGNVSNSQESSNTFSTYQIANSVTATLTAETCAKRLILGTNSTITGSMVTLYNPAINNFITQGSGATISSEVSMRINAARSQGALTFGGNVQYNWTNNLTLTMTGNWSVGGNLIIYGSSGTGSKATLNTNGNNLTVTGNLQLGFNSGSYPNALYGEVLFSSGTHSIGGNLYVPGEYTHGYVNFGTGATSVAGDMDLTYGTVSSSTGTLNMTDDNANIAIPGNFSIATLNMNGATQTLTLGGNLAVSTQFTPGTSSATFTATDSGNTVNIPVYSGGSPTLNKFYNLIFNGASGSWSTTNNLRVENDLTLTQGTFSDNNNTVYVGRDLIASGTSTRQYTITAGTSMTVVRDLIFSGSGGTFTVDTNTLLVGRHLNVSASNTFTHFETTTITLNGAAAQTFTTGDITFDTVNFSGAGPFTITGDFTVDDTATVTGTKTINCSGSFVIATTFTPATSTVVFNGTSSGKTIDIPIVNSFYNMTVNGSEGEWTLQKNLTVSNNLTLTLGKLIDNAKTVSFVNLSTAAVTDLLTSTGTWTQTASGTINCQHSGSKINDLVLASTGVTSTLDGDIHANKLTLADGTIAGATNDIYLYGALSGMISPAGATTVSSTLGNIYLEALTSQIAFQLPDSLVSGKVYVKATTQGGITALGNWNFSNNTVAFYETPAQDSFIDLDGNNLSCGDLKLGHDAQITYGADLRLDGGTHSIANISKAYSGTPTGTQAMNMESSTINCSGSLDFTNIALTSGTSTVNMTSSTGAKTVKAGGQTLNHLTFNDADTTWTLQDTLDVKGNLTLTAGTFTHNSRNVTISGTSGSISIIDGPFTFYNFSCTSEGKVLQFKQGETQTMTGTFTITGGAGADRVQIRSPIAGLTHTLAPAAVSVSYADIKDSTLTAERIGTNCFDSGNNTNWVLNPTFEITTPASGATLNVDSTPEIAWTSSGGITEVKLWYSTDASAGTPTWTLITPVAIANSDGANTYDWTVADAISEDCKIKVAAVLNGAVEESVLDLSDTFNIRGVLALTYPNDEGIGWPVGTARNITFTKTGTLGDVKVYCSTTGAEGDVWGEALATTSGTSYEWSPSGGHQSNNVYIKVTDADNEANVYDISDNSFTVGAGSLTAVTITDAGGDTERTTFICGNSYDIGWTTTGTVASVNISYSIDGGTNWTNIKTSVTNDDEYNGTGTGDDGPWAVENTPSANVLIKVAHSSDSNIYAVTDATTIATPFTVTTPPADIILTAGTAYVIGWTTTAGVSADTVTIEYSLTGSGSWTEINEGDYTATNDHSEVWNITAGLSTTTAKVRISDASDSTTYAYVDSSTFSLKRGSLAVTSPNSTVTWKVGTQHPIEWSTTGVINNVRLYYATDGDLETPTWNALVGGSLDDATGQYNWTIPDAISDNCLVKIVDAEDSGIFDISDAVFSIKPEFTLTAPNGGQDWAVGTTNDITWTNTGTVSQVDLQYSTNSGSTWTDIVTGLSNTGTYTWTVPTADSSNCKIKIISTSDSTVSDTSDAVFTISLASITITAPVAGNIWVRNDTNTIKWSTAGTCYDDMKIQYSPSGTFSGDVVDIATGETNDGTYSWEIPNDLTVSDTAKIRAQDMTWDTAGYDVIGTSGVFEITAPRIDLTAPNGGDTLTVAGSTDITWTSRGESIGANVEIRYSTDNFSSSTLIVDSTLDDGTYTWTDIPDDISDTVKVRVYDDSNLSIYDTSDTNLSIKGALTITSPAADATFYVGVAQDIEWTTTGTIANVDLFYSSDGGTTWKNMADLESTDEGYADSEIANDGSYSWSSPDAVNNDNTPKAISFKIVDSSDSTVYGTRDFTNSYYAATLNVTDLAGLVGHLRALAVTINYSSTGLTFGDFTGVVSPATQYFTPNVQFSVEVSRNGYLAGSTNFLADENDKTINIALDAAAINKERTVEIEHYYRPSTDMLYLNARLREQENLIPKNDEDNSIVGVTEFYVQIFDGNTEVLTSTTATTTLNTTGEFLAVWEDVRADGYLEEGTRYSARVRAEYEGTYHWNMNIIDITEAMTMYRINRAFGMSDADMLSGGDSIVSRLTASTTSLATTVASQATLTKAAVTASASTTQAAITAGTASTATAITTSQSTIASAVTSSQSSITSAVTKQASARIINEYTNFEAGDTFQIRYRTTSGITCTVSIYDADEETVVSAASMSEVGTTGIYTYDFETDDEGLYSIVCSGSNGTTDVIAVAAISADLETISSNITAVMGSVSGIDTASLASAAATIATLESSLATLSGALGGLTSMASEVDSISSELNQSISSALANISKAFDNVTSQVGVDLGNMGKIVEEGKSDRKYIQEKQEEVKAGVDLVRDIIEQGNDAPVQTTWMVSSETAEMDTGIIETIEE